MKHKQFLMIHPSPISHSDHLVKAQVWNVKYDYVMSVCLRLDYHCHREYFVMALDSHKLWDYGIVQQSGQLSISSSQDNNALLSSSSSFGEENKMHRNEKNERNYSTQRRVNSQPASKIINTFLISGCCARTSSGRVYFILGRLLLENEWTLEAGEIKMIRIFFLLMMRLNILHVDACSSLLGRSQIALWLWWRSIFVLVAWHDLTWFSSRSIKSITFVGRFMCGCAKHTARPCC